MATIVLLYLFSVAENNAAMASALFNALGALTGGDMWEAAENCPEMFDKGGYYYEKVVSDLGPLQPNQHCTLPVLPNKVSDAPVVEPDSTSAQYEHVNTMY